ncbi:MAG TPA: hypothetical protein GXX29_15080 [Firmicutes bacterium]|nr:hypothetical protein [Bacillota bacterium]
MKAYHNIVDAMAEPQPGEIFREYSWAGPYVNASRWQRVTDPQARHPGAAKHLPNPVNTICLDDLELATKAELYLEQWGGHAGTTAKRLRLNGNDWIDLPESPYLGPAAPESYQYMRFRTLPIPLSQLREGDNTFEFTSGGQIAHDFG